MEDKNIWGRGVTMKKHYLTTNTKILRQAFRKFMIDYSDCPIVMDKTENTLTIVAYPDMKKTDEVSR